jgi:hypothetical protein
MAIDALDDCHRRAVNADQACQLVHVDFAAGHGHVVNRNAAWHHREVECDGSGDAGVDAHDDGHDKRKHIRAIKILVFCIE